MSKANPAMIHRRRLSFFSLASLSATLGTAEGAALGGIEATPTVREGTLVGMAAVTGGGSGTIGRGAGTLARPV
ncbi:hypothetical protein Rhe02_70230 [Rhizocola hellebori]|uniref:Uncharacterized protein n=1 Tax=Rhizocola hellebori TaxID=1392758 RepID=A0A8J3QDY6_9ACTN|nr:hypothetical protein Rhe02_70230 [Rhizocola hellebori]